MGSDFLAAKLHDPLVHTSLLADFVSSLVKGAIYVAVAVGAAAAATAAVAATIGSGGTAGPVVVFLISNIIIGGVGAGFGSLIDDIADGAGALVDDALDFFGMKGKPDGLIVTGSPDVRIKKQPAARAAGKLPPAGELANLRRKTPGDRTKTRVRGTSLPIYFLHCCPLPGWRKWPGIFWQIPQLQYRKWWRRLWRVQIPIPHPPMKIK